MGEGSTPWSCASLEQGRKAGPLTRVMLGLIQRAVCEKVDGPSVSRTLAPQIRKLTGGPLGIS